MLALVALLVILIFLYAVFTLPDRAAIIGGSLPADTPFQAKPDAASAAQTDWLTSVKDLGQLFLITPVFPLIGAVIGYIFGVSRQASADATDVPVGA